MPRRWPIVNRWSPRWRPITSPSRFTIGPGLGIDCPAAEPYYVVRIDAEGNRLVVGSAKDLHRSECRVADINWINRPADFPVDVQVKIRYRHPAAPARLMSWKDDARMQIRFQTPQKAITPGQGAVFYAGEEVLGGGWIV